MGDKKKRTKKLFDFVIGNPPYQIENDKNGRNPPVYNLFMDEATKVANAVELITPARFLFNAGQTPKEWNHKKLTDSHFKVLQYVADASKLFPNTDIKGGVAITLNDDLKTFAPIEVFTTSALMNDILHKVIQKTTQSISSIVVGAVPYHFSDILRDSCPPPIVQKLPESFDLRTNVLDKLNGILFFSAPQSSKEQYVKIYGLLEKKRSALWILRKYISTEKAPNFTGYKVLISKASGAGHFGEALSAPFIAQPNEGHTQTFISLGNFKTEIEAFNLKKYIQSKFFRAMLDVLKTTQDLSVAKFKYVPLQDFTANSDIDWSKSIHEIDLQLYRKYNLDENEINFIETHVKEMA